MVGHQWYRRSFVVIGASSLGCTHDQPEAAGSHRQYSRRNEPSQITSCLVRKFGLHIGSTQKISSSHWLNAIPIPSLGLKLDDKQLRISVGLRLGSPLCHPHHCECCVRVTSDGIHGLSCKKSSGRWSRHGQINDIIHRALSTAGVTTILEPAGVSHNDGKRPDGVFVFPWKRGKLLCWDYTCSDTLAPSHLSSSSRAAAKIA